MKKLPNNAPVPQNVQLDMYYTQPLLATVIALPEVIMMWGKSRRTIEIAIWTGKLESRKVCSGGVILITRESLVKLWGPPTFDYVDGLLMPGEFNFTEEN